VAIGDLALQQIDEFQAGMPATRLLAPATADDHHVIAWLQFRRGG
jgi:hypothetical protein